MVKILKLLFLFALCSIPGNVSAQEQHETDSIKVHAQIIGMNNNVLKIGTKLTIEMEEIRLLMRMGRK